MIQDKHSGKIAGYINAIPLEQEFYRAIESGSIIDLSIPPDAIRRYDLPDFYLLYFSSIGIHLNIKTHPPSVHYMMLLLITL